LVALTLLVLRLLLASVAVGVGCTFLTGVAVGLGSVDQAAAVLTLKPVVVL
jgi:hypothetical protein